MIVTASVWARKRLVFQSSPALAPGNPLAQSTSCSPLVATARVKFPTENKVLIVRFGKFCSWSTIWFLADPELVGLSSPLQRLREADQSVSLRTSGPMVRPAWSPSR